MNANHACTSDEMISTSSMAFQLGASTSFSSSSIDCKHKWTHDVFLNFRGEDVRQGFISHLYHDLHDQRGINTFIDDNIERGEEILQELSKAIEGSRISIIILSKNYSESRWCLDELLKILDCKETVKQIVLPLFYYVNPTEVRHQNGSFGKAFAKLKDKFKDEAKVTKWEAALEKIANLSGLELGDGKEAEFIETIGKWVESIIKPTVKYVTKHPVGIKSRLQDIFQHLNIERNDDTCIVGIFGMGGIGKTTILKEIYNNISSQFEGQCCFLQNIRETSKPRDLIRLQKTLLSKILGISLEFHDTDEGINEIRRRLCSKRILLILDDVDDLVQLETLAGARDWFGAGSRIIITTRDQKILDNFKVDSKYELMTMDDNDALELFSLYAFKGKEPLKDYVDLSKQVIKYAQGLPLALTVLGSDLHGRNIYEWKSALDKYKKIPNQKIQRVLQISYDSLAVNEKDMFLDVAFFFKREPLAKVREIFDSCNFYPDDGIRRLMEKCLITVEGHSDHKYIWMHDLLQDMGKEIVQEISYKDPSKRSRLWLHDDVRQVLEEDTGSNQIEGIVLDLPEGHEEEIRLHPEAFRHMPKLRIFINRNARFSRGPDYLSDKLRVLDWDNYPSQYLPRNFQGNKLVFFRMHQSMMKKLGDGFKPKNLKIMVFEYCNYFTEIPDLSSTSNLEELMVSCCDRLVRVHDSVGSLENLSYLCFWRCSKLKILPRSLKLTSLDQLSLQHCSSLRNLPEIDGKMKSLWRLDIEGTAVEELPLSFGNLVGLDYINISNCKKLRRLPIALIKRHLKGLGIGGRTNLPNSSNGSICSRSDPNFFPLRSFFTMFNYLATSLSSLYLEKAEIVSLPTSIKEFVTLTDLNLRFCPKLEEILELPPEIRSIDVTGCKSLERFLEVSKILEFNGSHIRSLQTIMLGGCDKMHENILNCKVQNPLLGKGLYEYDATLFPKNTIPAWLNYVDEFLEDNEMSKEPGDYVKPRGEEEWTVDMEGPHYLEEISGIVLYVVILFKDASNWSSYIGDVKITCNNSNHICRIETAVQLVNLDWGKKENAQYVVWVGYSNLQSFELKVLDNLRVQFDLHQSEWFYKSCRAKVVYKNERRATEIQ